MKRSPLRAKRPTPRRKAPERVAYVRTKRPRVSKTAEEARHLERVAAMPCLITGAWPVHVHHLMKAPGKRARRDHRWVVPLSPALHNLGDFSVHSIGSEAGFEQVHGLIDGYLVAWAKRQWNITQEEGK